MGSRIIKVMFTITYIACIFLLVHSCIAKEHKKAIVLSEGHVIVRSVTSWGIGVGNSTFGDTTVTIEKVPFTITEDDIKK